MMSNFLFLTLILVTIVGVLFGGVYMEVAQAAFYREVTRTEVQNETMYIENQF